MVDNKHENYEILNLIGYGLAKFDMNLVRQFGYQTKTELGAIPICPLDYDLIL